jgi:hypothetical protein
MPSLRHCSGGGYRGILAAVPPAQRLRSASGKGAADLKPSQSQSQSNGNGKGKINNNNFASRLAPTMDRRTALLFTTHQAER